MSVRVPRLASAATTLTRLREYVTREGLTNVTVVEGAAAATNLPAACCDAIFMRNVYHHITQVEPFNRSLAASLEAGSSDPASGGAKAPPSICH
jgi:hypothetical protein